MFDAASATPQLAPQPTRARARRRQNISLDNQTTWMVQESSSANASLIQIYPDERALDLIVYWKGSLANLKSILNGMSDWGPFELTVFTALQFGKESKRKVFCRFVYHGPKRSRAHFESNLKNLMQEYMRWEDYSPPKRMA